MPKVYEIKDFARGYDDSVSEDHSRENTTQDCVHTEYVSERGAVSKDVGERNVGYTSIFASVSLDTYPMNEGDPVQLLYQGSMWGSSTGEWFTKRFAVCGGKMYQFCDGDLFIPLEGGSTIFEELATDFVDATHYQDMFIITDGENDIREWGGFDNNVDILGMYASTGTSVSTSQTLKADCVEVFRNRVFIGNVNNAGTEYDSRVQWSSLGDPNDWPVANYNDVIDKEGDEVVRLKAYGDSLIIFKRNSVHKAVYTGGDLPYFFTQVDANTVNNAPWTVAQIPNGLVFLNEEGLNITDGNNVTRLEADKRIQGLLKRIYVGSIDRAYGVSDDGENEYNLLVPIDGSPTCNYMITWNWQEDTWKIREIDANVLGLFTDLKAGTWDSIIDYYGYELIGLSWDSRLLYPGSKRLMFGRDDGYVRERSIAYNRQGSAYTCYHTTPWLDFDLPGIYKEVVKIRPRWKGISGTNVDVYYKTDDDTDWTALTTDNFDSTGVVESPFLYLRDTGMRWKFKFENSNANEAFTLYRCNIYFEQRGER